MKIQRTYRLYLGNSRYNPMLGRIEQETIEVKVFGGLKELKESGEWQFNTYGSGEYKQEPKWELIKEEVVKEDAFE